jgi:hypothetical protein
MAANTSGTVASITRSTANPGGIIFEVTVEGFATEPTQISKANTGGGPRAA